MEKKKRISNRLISVLKEPERAKSYFIEAQVPKETIYIGEGIDVQYFVYSKGRILSSELQVYPKLNNFIKRFIDVSKTPSEKVSYKGEIYDRHLIYAARVYPEKTGRLYLDPVKMKLTGMFGSASIFGMGQARTLSLSSQSIQIQVMPLPADGVPTNFTGLVGDHDMIFKLNKSKFVVNEIIEGNLEVNGEGLLEKFEAPVLYQHNALEKFDTRSEIIKIDKTTVKKVFDYTFIPRSGLLLEGRSFSLSFFDPEEKRYYEKSFDLPEISVSGEASQNKQQETQETMENPQEMGLNKIEFNEISLVGPMDLRESFFVLKNIKTVNIFLSSVIFMVLLFSIKLKRTSVSRKKILLRKINRIRKEGVTYSNLYDLLSTYYGKELSAKEIINVSSLSVEAKRYFQEILEEVGHHEFSKNKGIKNINIKNRYFKEFLK